MSKKTALFTGQHNSAAYFGSKSAYDDFRQLTKYIPDSHPNYFETVF
jgi:hypothetical protein